MATAAEDVEAFLATCASSGDAEDVEAFLATCAASGDAAYDAAKAMLERLDAPTKYADPFLRPPLLRSRHAAPSRSQRSTWMMSKRWTSLRCAVYSHPGCVSCFVRVVWEATEAIKILYYGLGEVGV